MATCPKCGIEAGEAKFCPNCGTKLEETNPPTAADDTAPADSGVNSDTSSTGSAEPSAPADGGVNSAEPMSAASGQDYYDAMKKLEDEKNAEKKKKKKRKAIGCCSVLLALVLVIGIASLVKKGSLTAEEKTQVKEMISSINELPETVDVKDEEKVKALKKGFEKLNEKQQKKVKNYKKLTKAEKTINKNKVKAVEDAIAKIGSVTVDSGDAILTAKAQYEDLPKELKSEVKSVDKLEEAQSTYETLCADQVIRLIDGLGEITLESKSKLDEVNKYYGQLSAESKKLVTNYDKYTAANKKYGELVEAEKKRAKAEQLKQFKAALSGLKHHSDSIRGFTWYEPNSYPKYINSRSFFLPYICCDTKTGEFVSMNIKANYFGDDWVFWKEITVNVDGKNYYLSAKYSDINHDNARGDVWESYDFSELEYDVGMLRAIAKSKKTIVRYEGDHYYRDFVISDSDKQGIKQILKAYDIANQKDT